MQYARSEVQTPATAKKIKITSSNIHAIELWAILSYLHLVPLQHVLMECDSKVV